MNLLHEPMNLEAAYGLLLKREKRRHRRRMVMLAALVTIYVIAIAWCIYAVLESK